MDAILFKQYQTLRAIPVSEQNEAALRETLHRLLGGIHQAGTDRLDPEEFRALTQITQDCYRRLRALETSTLLRREQTAPAPCELTAFLRELACACDLLLGASGRRFTARLPRGRVRLTCDAPLLRAALLHLLTNALQYGGDAPVLRVTQTRRGVLFCVAGGTLTPERFRRAVVGNGGLRAAAHIAALHGGRLTLAIGREDARVAFLIPNGLTQKAEPSPIPRFSDYICDRLSPLYVGLCEVCPCPV